jgi:hypothetical protein
LLRSVARVRARHGPSPSRPENPARLSRQVFFPCTNSPSHYRALLHTFQVPDDLRKAMANLGAPNPNEARAVDARQEIDLKVRKRKPYVFRPSPPSPVTRLQGRLLLHTLSNPIFSRPLQWLELRARIVWPLPGLFFETVTSKLHKVSQTPTLGFCVARADEITRFVPEPYAALSDASARPPHTPVSDIGHCMPLSACAVGQALWIAPGAAL